MGSSERTEETSASATPPATSATPPATSATPPAEPDARRPGPENRGELSGRMATASDVEAISISCLQNAHYHAGREAFLDTVHRWFMFGVVALGAAALIDVFPDNRKEWLKALCSAGAALLGALDITFDLSNRARVHSMMRRRYFDLLADVREGKKTPTEARVCLERYSGDEEPPYRVLLLACWNLAQTGVYGSNASSFEITKWGLATKNFFRRPGAIYRVKESSKA